MNNIMRAALKEWDEQVFHPGMCTGDSVMNGQLFVKWLEVMQRSGFYWGA